MMVFMQSLATVLLITFHWDILTWWECGESDRGFLPKCDGDGRAAQQSSDVGTDRWRAEIASLLTCLWLHVLRTCWDSCWLTLLHVSAPPLAAHVDVLHCAAFLPAALQSLLNRTFYVFRCHLHDSTGTDLLMVGCFCFFLLHVGHTKRLYSINILLGLSQLICI